MTVRQDNYPLNSEASHTLVIHCSDFRFQEAFQLFVAEETGIKNYDALVIPGASQLLTFIDSLPKLAQIVIRPLKFLVKEHGLNRVIVIMHEDCSWYHNFVPKFVQMKENIKEQQVKDMLMTKRILCEEFSKMEVRMFYAAINHENQVQFSEIKEV